ncbi:MFS transporter [Fructilactobacillus carniphilus]|uniref:MFS transporter n=1 Tax=Fructilactobacillus carniphilus TaxID=2940297 RepID=A0ABY5BVA5_9LACO|nr:MFS transporter [Fructilactobacillus carniphilus]USS90267.1 MFS transporter [Fructilactobacillus carniphilus]
MELRLFFSKTFSQVGDLIFNTLLDLWILNTFGSSKTLATSLAVASSANFIASFVGGYLADSRYVGKFLLGIEFFSVVISFLNLFYLTAIGNQRPSILIINLFLFLINFSNFLLSPLMKKAISSYVQRERIPTYNQWTSVVGQVLTIVIPAISTILYTKHFLTIEWALGINAVSFLIGFILLLPLLKFKLPPRNPDNRYSNTIKYVFRVPRLQEIILLGTILSLFSAELNVFAPVFVTKTLHQQALYGIVVSFMAVGGILGALSMHYFKIGKTLKTEYSFLALLVLSLFVIFGFPNIYSMCLLAIIANLNLVRYGVLSQTFIQLQVPAEIIGKTFSVLFFCLNLVMPLGSYLIGLVINQSSFLVSLLLIGTALLPFTMILVYRQKA